MFQIDYNSLLENRFTTPSKKRNFLLFACIFLTATIWTACRVQESMLDTQKPAENRFTKVILTQGMDEPMTMDFLPNGKIIIIERKGGVKILDESSKTMSLIATIPVNTKYKNKEGHVREAEEGLMGVIAHPDFEQNNWIFLYYADPDEPKHVLARWELRGNELVESSKVVVLEVPTQREECCHTGGGMVFDAEGNLYLSVGNNTVNPRTGASNLDERPGHENSDDQRGPSNSNDLRGKILRIHPEDDGSYSIPAGNLYPEGTANARPEIYTMGHRNPWRVSLDSKTGYLYWGEVGPDANKDSVWGPKGYDEFNQAKGPGFFGWPYFVGDNRPYNAIDGYEDGEPIYGAAFDVNHPVNNSVNNTGVKELPTPIPAFISYPYGPSETFPMLGSAGRSATGGPVYRKADFPNAERPFPNYYEGKWLIIDFMRDWIMAVSMDESGDYVSMERFLPNESFNAAIDMDFGPSGDLYVLEYGDAWFRQNANARLVRIEYNAGNRKPIVQASADKQAGAVPLSVQFSSEGTHDYDAYDQNALKYQWDIKDWEGKVKVLLDPNPSMEFDQPGVYQVSLTVTDSKEASNTASFEIVAGNEPPEVVIDFKGANQSFYFGDQQLPYAIAINDKEDGTITNADEAAITFDYVPAGFDPIEVASKQSGADLLAVDAIGKRLIESNDCRSCHQYEAASIGPSYAEVAKKYPNTPENRRMLTQRVINGSSGVWGEHAMAAHPELSPAHASRMVRFIMGIQDEKPSIEALPLEGTISPRLPKGEDGSGVYVLRAAYQDKGGTDLLGLTSEAFISLQNPVMFPPFSEDRDNTRYLTTPRTTFSILGPEAYIAMPHTDLTGINRIEIFAQAISRLEAKGGKVELRLGGPDGQLLATSNVIGQKDFPRRGWGQNNGKMSPEERKKARRARSQALTLSFDPVEGFQDIYLVFKNPEVGEHKVMMTVSELEFYQSKEEL